MGWKNRKTGIGNHPEEVKVNEDQKQIMYLNYQGFTNIMWNLQTEINLLWTQGMVEQVYERIKLLFMHVESHLKEKDVGTKYFNKRFKEIEELIYNPSNYKHTTMAKARRERVKRQANDKMMELYRELKKNMKESQLEAFYGIPAQTMIDAKRKSNIDKVFGKEK